MEKNDFSLEVSPILTRIKIYTSTVSATIKVKNTASKDIDLRLQLQPIGPSSNKDGSFSFTNALFGQDKAFLRKIIILDGEKEVKTTKVAPFEEKTFTLKLNLGDKFTPGDYYFSLLFIRTDRQSMSNSNINQATSYSKVTAGVASNFLVSVKPSQAKLSNVKVSSPIFLTRGPLPVEVLVENPSNTLLTVTGNILITNMFGQTVGKIPLTNRYVLAKSERYVTASRTSNISKGIEVLQDSSKTTYWNEKFLLGFYSVRAEVRDKETGQMKVAQTKLLAVPLFMIVILIVIAFILGGLYLRVKRKV